MTHLKLLKMVRPILIEAFEEWSNGEDCYAEALDFVEVELNIQPLTSGNTVVGFPFTSPPPPHTPTISPRDQETIVKPGSLAEKFKKRFAKLIIFDIQNYKWDIGPDMWASIEVKRKALCQYHIKFNDGSDIRVILTDGQYYGIRRSLFWNNVVTIGGESHRIHK